MPGQWGKPVRIMSGSKTMRSNKPKDKSVRHKIELVDKKVKKIQRDIELKNRAFDIGFTAIQQNWSTLVLANGLTQGVADGQRVGDRARFTSIRITGEIQRDSDNLVPNTVRMLVFWDSQPNGATPPLVATTESLFNIPSIAANNINATYNLDNQKRYKVLLDKRWVFNTGAYDTTGTIWFPTRHLFNFYIKLSRESIYTANNGTIADLTKNSLYIAFCTDQSGAAGSELPEVRYAFNIYYKDT